MIPSLAPLLVLRVAGDHVLQHLVLLPPVGAHGVVHHLALLRSMLLTVRDQLDVTNLNLLVFSHLNIHISPVVSSVLCEQYLVILNAASFLIRLLTLLFLMRDKLGHKGVVAPGVGFMDAGGDLREVRVLHHHNLVHADQVPLPCAVILDRIDKVRGSSESF